MNKGIDIEKAMSILSVRASSRSDTHSINASIDRDNRTINPSEVPSMNGCSCTADTSHSIPLCGDCSPYTIDSQALIQSHCAQMNLKDRLDLLFHLQSERVQTYAIYDSGLQTIISNGNVSQYPALCAQITATFSVLSNSINTICTVLEENNHPNPLATLDDNTKVHKVAAKFIKKLQQLEKEKLNLTAALHLEKIRIHHCETSDDEQSTTKVLLQESKKQLIKSLSIVIENINEVLEELHAVAVDT